MQDLKITIITPSYNQGEYLEDTLLSVLSQQYANLEYIVMDGGSTDNSADLIRKYESQLKFWESVKDKGQSDAINKGLKMASGDVVAYLNSDDLYVPGTFNYVNKFFNENPDVDVLIGKTEFVDENGLPTKGFADLFDKELNDQSMYAGCYIPQPSVFIKRKVIDQQGLFDQTLHYCFDYEYWLRIYNAGFKFKQVSQKLSLFRLQPSSKTNTAYTSGKFDAEFLRIFKHYYGKVSESGKRKTLIEAYATFTRLYYLHIEETFGIAKAKKESFEKIMEFKPSLRSTNILKLFIWLLLPDFIRKLRIGK